MTLKPSLIIFDCDGVLIDSEVIACRVDAEEFSRLGFVLTAEDVAERFVGKTAGEMFATLQAEQGRPIPEGFAAHLSARIHEAFERELRPIPSVAETLARLDMAICVASSSGPERLERSLGITGLFDHFAPHVFSAHMVARGKPAPDLFHHAAAAMGHEPENCLVIEDSVAGVQAAVAARMRVFGFAGGSHCTTAHGGRLEAEGAELSFRDMAALPGLLQQP